MARINLYVGAAQQGGARNAQAAWIAVNGDPENPAKGSQHFKKISKKMPKEHLAMLALSEAIKQQPDDAKITIHCTDQTLCDFVNGDTFSFLKRAFETEHKTTPKGKKNAPPKAVETAAMGLIANIIRKPNVRANFVSEATEGDEKHISLLQEAYEIACGKLEKSETKNDFKHKKEKRPTRAEDERAHIAMSEAEGDLSDGGQDLKYG